MTRSANHYRLDALNRLADRRERRRQAGALQREAAWQQISSGPPRLVTVQSRNGRLTFDSRDSVIGSTLFRDRNWEYDLIQRTTQSLRKHALLDRGRSTLVDAGANIGSTTVAFLREGTFERAVAIEPDAANLDLLQRNVRQNGLKDRVRCVATALGARQGEVELEMSPDNFGDHRVRASSAPGAYDEAGRATHLVPMERLDNLLREETAFGLDTVGLLWIDVQGFEGHVLQGAPQLLSLGIPVEMELWPYGLARAGTSRDAFLSLLTASFTKVIDLRDPTLRVRSIAGVEELYDAHVGPYADTELLLFDA